MNKLALVLLLSFYVLYGYSQAKILFDATKAQTAGNADWQIDADIFNIKFINGQAVVTNNGREANPQRFPTPPASEIDPQSPEDFWKGGLSAWAIECVKNGYQVETLPIGSAITFNDGSNIQDLKNYQVFVICEPNIAFTHEESKAIKAFVANGGSLFMICNHKGSDRNNDGVDSPTIFNEMMGTDWPFGIKFDSVSIWAASNNVNYFPGDEIVDGPFGKVDSIVLSAGTKMTLFPDKNSTVKGRFYASNSSFGNFDVLAATSAYGSGKVFAITDSSIPDDGSGDTNDQLYDGWLGDGNGSHRRLIMNATTWLASNSQSALVIDGTVERVRCFNENTGSIDVNVTGGNGQYSFLWSNGQTTDKIENLSAGKYIVTVTSANLLLVDSFIVTQPSKSLEIFTASNSINCIGPGLVEAFVLGGTPPYNYLWSNNQNSSYFTTSIPGEYTIVVSDSANCSLSAQVVLLTSFTIPVGEIQGDSVLNCNIIEVKLKAITEVDKMWIKWNGPDLTSTDENVVISKPGKYVLTLISKLNGCISKDSVFVISDTDIPNVFIDEIVNDIDQQSTGSAIVSPSLGQGPLNYHWVNALGEIISSDSIVQNVSAGIYTCNIKGMNGCETTIIVEVQNISSIDEDHHVQKWRLFPNPSQEKLNFTGKTSNQLYVEIRDILGRCMIKTKISSEESIEISHLPLGTYIVHICEGQQCSEHVFLR